MSQRSESARRKRENTIGRLVNAIDRQRARARRAAGLEPKPPTPLDLLLEVES